MTTEIDRRGFLRTVRDALPITAAVILSPQNAAAQTIQPYPNLDQYLETIKDEKASGDSAIESHPELFNLPSDLVGFQTNFPFYKAAEISYGTPWLLTYITHRQETTFSNDPNTYNNLYAGAMQRSRGWSNSLVDEAAQNWTFLQNLSQRRPDDWKEIIWGAKYIKDNVKGEGEEAFLQAIYGYCAPGPAAFRISLYRKWKTVFTPDNP